MPRVANDDVALKSGEPTESKAVMLNESVGVTIVASAPLSEPLGLSGSLAPSSETVALGARTMSLFVPSR